MPKTFESSLSINQICSEKFIEARPLFFKYNRGKLTASHYILFPGLGTGRSKYGEVVSVGDSFCIGGERKKSGFPWVTFRNISPPTLAIEWGYRGLDHKVAHVYIVNEDGTYVTLGDTGLVRIVHGHRPQDWYDNSQARFIGSPEIKKRFADTFRGNCYNPNCEIFQKIGNEIYTYDPKTGLLQKQDRLMAIGTASTCHESDEMGNEGNGQNRAQFRILDGIPVIRTFWSRAAEGICMGIIPILEDGIYTTVTPQIVLRLAPNPAMIFSDISLIQRYNSVFNGHWYKEEEE